MNRLIQRIGFPGLCPVLMGEEPVGMVRSFTHLIQKLDMKVGEGDDVRFRRIAAGFAPLRGDGPVFVVQIEFPPIADAPGLRRAE